MVEALRAGHAVKRFKATGADAHRTYRLSLSAKGIRHGSDISIRIHVVRANAASHSTLTARRLYEPLTDGQRGSRAHAPK